MSDAMLIDGSAVTLDGDQLVVRAPTGARRVYALDRVANVTQANAAPQVFLRLVTAEEVVLPAASFKDADRIADWLRRAPRLHRRATHQRAVRRARARDRMRYGAVAFVGGVGIMLYTYTNAQPGGWFVVPFGAIIVGGTQGLRGVLQYFFD